MKRFYIIYKGIVQGVGFRYTLTKLANMYNLTGFCENLDNGDVLCEIQGNEESITAFIKNSVQPRRYIFVEDYSVKEIDVDNTERYFNVVY